MRKLFPFLVMIMVCSVGVYAQTVTYHGSVQDAANNEPLIGATVMPIGGGQGVATDIDGNFTLTVPSNVHKVKVSYVGYNSQEVGLTDKMIVRLSNNTQNLDDLVVVAYGTANKESLTGSVAVVGAREIEDRPVTSVTAALEGNAPGVQVNNSTGTPGSDPVIRIRGFNSINGNNSPLYVVDGVPFEGDINDLNPQDIESMSVLKDAASSALYGNRGANGVILINTKRAKTVGKVDVNLQVRQGFYDRALPFYDKLGVEDWMQAQFDAHVNGDLRTYDLQYPEYGITKADVIADLAGGSIMSDYLVSNIFGVDNDKLFDSVTGKYCGAAPLPGYKDDLDWWDAIAHTGYRQEYNMNASGATEKFNVFASIGYLKENGYTIGTDFDRFNGRINVNFTPVDYLKMGVNIAATQQESEMGQVDSSELDGINNPFNTETYAPIYPYYMHDKDGNVVMEDGSPVWNTAGYINGSNVAWEQRLNRNNFSKTAIDGSAYVTAILPYGFEVTLRGQMWRNKYNILKYNNNIVGSQADSGMLRKYYMDYRTHTFMQNISWSHEYGLNHVDVYLAHENYNYDLKQDMIQKSNQLLEDHIDLNNFTDLQYGISSIEQRRLESYLARARYNYAQKYFGEVSVRRDGSSRFAKDYRWGTFWSLGASWIITKEHFMRDADWVNYLKLRAAYGSVGNDASAPAYAYWTLYDWISWPGGPGATLVPSSLGTENLKWEATKTLDVALEGSLFDDRLNFSVGYFDKRNTDLLFRMSLPGSSGSLGASPDEDMSGNNPIVWKNVGAMKNYGWEIGIGVDIIRNKDFKWDFNADATFMTNKVTKLPDGHDIPAQNLYIGKSIYEHKYYHWAGVDQLTGQSMYEIVPNSPDLWVWNAEKGVGEYDDAAFQQKVAKAKADGNAVFIEEDGKYYTSNKAYATRVLCGTSLPTVYGSFGTNLSWKGINLGLLFTYSLGGKTYDDNYASLMSTSTVGALHKDVLKSWTEAPEGMTEDSPNRIDPNGIPQLNTRYSQYNDANSSDRWLTSNNYLTLKNINVSYDFPSKWVNALKLQNINLGMSIDNVFIVTKRKGMNPQYNWDGSQGRYYVPARVVSFQLNVKF